MATLSPPVSLPSRPQSLVDARARPSISRPSSPSPQAGESATTIAWRNALNSYRRSLSDKDFKRIMIPVGPEDVANEVEKWQCRQSASWHSHPSRCGRPSWRRSHAAIQCFNRHARSGFAEPRLSSVGFHQIRPDRRYQLHLFASARIRDLLHMLRSAN